MNRSLGASVLWAAVGLAWLPIAGCVVVTGTAGCEVAAYKETRTITLPYVSGSGLDVETRNGSITVDKQGVEGVVITAKLAAVSPERLAATTVTADYGEGGALVVRVLWPDGERRGSESCAFHIATPGAEGLTLTTSNGAIAAAGFQGDAAVQTSNGSISVSDHAGDVTAHTSNGKVSLVNVGGASARTSNGAIDVRLAADAPGPVEADTSNGSITLAIGPAFAGELSASTSNGSIQANAPQARAVGAISRRHATFAFGSGGGRSQLSTSNGSITIVSVE